MTSLVFSKKASADLQAIRRNGENNFGIKRAIEYNLGILRRCIALKENPQIGQSADSICSGLRRFGVDSHIVYYRYSESQKKVMIVRILHGRMDPALHL